MSTLELSEEETQLIEIPEYELKTLPRPKGRDTRAIITE